MEMTFVFIISIFMCIFIHFLSVYGLTVGSYCILFILSLYVKILKTGVVVGNSENKCRVRRLINLRTEAICIIKNINKR